MLGAFFVRTASVPRIRMRTPASRKRLRQRAGHKNARGSCPGHFDYSHSIVPGGFDVTSRTTRLTSSTSFVMRFEMRASTS